ncbi:periplasmic nitrate reductase chaperone NapD [Colwellia chukchiensis]|uniref:Periplasmic nitrate reductase chaperone NapD n=1 Tax=Colwellia chukchiensis TaxID=641665 RepID=A0A1H7GB43_9GAMM|nr:chaperone NapD [Colwellia chukchiensis]SEK33035.1 periplasmic nitrate reductase chaperone NapD [Colwellia chukchiensis]
MINLLEESPVHIAGVMFMVYPENANDIAAQLIKFPGAELHATGENGSLVMTVEGLEGESEQAKRIINTITDMSNVSGVISSSLIFHHNDAGLPQHQGKTL